MRRNGELLAGICGDVAAKKGKAGGTRGNLMQRKF
jgi:hypothetical protein